MNGAMMRRRVAAARGVISAAILQAMLAWDASRRESEARVRDRIIYDIVLTVVLVFEMLYQVTGNTAHEIVGAAFFACIVAHLVMNRRWMGNVAGSLKAGTLAKRNRLILAIVALLAVDMVLLIISSIVVSQTLWNAGVNLSALNPGNIWYPIHVASSYALCILVLFHLSVHWVTVADVLNIQYDPSRREAIGSGVNAVLTMGAIALGIGGAMRTGFEASDFAVTAEDADSEDSKTVTSGYREINAETGEVVEDAVDVQVSAESDEGSSSAGEAKRCPLCPRQCSLSAPRCERPYEEGLIS